MKGNDRRWGAAPNSLSAANRREKEREKKSNITGIVGYKQNKMGDDCKHKCLAK